MKKAFSFLSKQASPGSLNSKRECAEPAKAAIIDLLANMKRKEEASESSFRVLNFIREHAADENILAVQDAGGLNLLDRAVLCDQPEIVTVIMMNNSDFEVYHDALDLACKIGHCRVVETIFRHMDEVRIPQTACFNPKASPSSRRSQQGVRTSWQLAFSLIYKAVQNDHADVVECLLTQPMFEGVLEQGLSQNVQHGNKGRLQERLILHEACKRKASKCVRYISGVFPNLLEVRNSEGSPPLVTAVVMDSQCAIALIENGAELSGDTFTYQRFKGPLLHLLYQSTNRKDIFSLTKLMMAKGYTKYINNVDSRGDTALGILLCCVGQRMMKERQEVYDQEVLNCIDFLLEKGADPLKTNNFVENGLHLLLSDRRGSPLSTYDRHYSLNAGYYNAVLNEKLKAMDIILSKHVNPNIPSESDMRYALFGVTNILCNMSPFSVKATAEVVRKLYHMLINHKADTSVYNMDGDNLASLLFNALNRWLNHSAGFDDQFHFAISFVHELTELFIGHGLLSTEILKNNFKQLMIIINLNVPDPKFVRGVRDILKLLIQNGGDPNQMKTDDTGTLDSRRHGHAHSAVYYLIRGLYIHERDQNDQTVYFLQIFNNTLHQKRLVVLVDIMACLLQNEFHSIYFDTTNMKRKVLSLCANPRPLKCLSRIAICSGLRWRLKSHCERLPIPKSLQEYIHEIS